MRPAILSLCCALVVSARLPAAPPASEFPAEKVRQGLDRVKDLEITGPTLDKAVRQLSEQTGVPFAADPVLNNDAQVRVVAHNVGTNRAAGAILEVWEGAQRVAGPVTFDISPGADATLTVLWRPASTGTHVLMFSLRAATGTDIRN